MYIGDCSTQLYNIGIINKAGWFIFKVINVQVNIPYIDPMGIGIYTKPIPFQPFQRPISCGDTESEAQRAELLEEGKRKLQ